MCNKNHNGPVRAAIAALATVLLATGCATPSAGPEVPATAAIQDEHGFVISQDLRVSPEAQADFAAALGLLQQERYQEGIDLLVSVAERAPDAAAAHINLGIAYARLGRSDEAEASMLRALALNPQHPVAHNEMGMLCRKTGRFDAARAHYEQALASYPGFHYARRNLAVLCDIYLGDLECALEHYERYVESAPEDGEAAMWVADLRNRLGQ
ncbi:tetratricopeptide repeat protein [Thioalkalivibrio sp. XN279]|uniref:tetratricopeptide repeat protein n=1 Tax=Thioalkalivibrio sp. XN279 TaxID=2714953 RepID=UPI00140C1A01|nr:tetratricopeptide repeat protein [Thioalkalivibrio sp. XN279]NHA14237.1 tetratricopeptide repeat protein [Thioalkalivibrio sp. XN279]